MARRLQYMEEDMKNAVSAVKNGMPALRASKQFGVPRTTLLDKVAGRVPIERKIGPETVLKQEEESLLVKRMFHVAKCGFPITKEALLGSVQMLLRQMDRVTPFTNGKPGRHWYELFLKCHPEISQRVTQNLTKARSSVTELKIRGWFSEIQNYIDDNNLADPSDMLLDSNNLHDYTDTDNNFLELRQEIMEQKDNGNEVNTSNHPIDTQRLDENSKPIETVLRNETEENQVTVVERTDHYQALVEKSPIKRISGGENIPTPFKKALFWPSSENQPTTRNNRKQREKLPAVASSSSWQEYHRRKLGKKETEQREKEDRKLAKTTESRQKTRNKGEIEKENQPLSKTDQYDIGDYVIVEYDSECFPGLVIDMSEQSYTMKAIERSGGNWKWPNVDDILEYDFEEIICKIAESK
ncbi:hypothetical protein JTB14_035680 [Gonioctena quinquepunctata]|nr:hypothetical protein JTB14_035680 [Gonioctena quinquepunctata]